MKKLTALILLISLLVPSALAGSVRPQGSAAYLTDVNLLVCVYLETKEPWDQDARAYTAYALNTAADYIQSAGEALGKPIRLITGADHDDLCYTFRYAQAQRHDAQDGERFDEELLDFIHDRIPSQALMDRYGAEGIAYLFFAPFPGGSYAMVYYEEDDPFYYPEYCVLYAFDGSSPTEYESVAVYAHEILHLFGAVDLYQTNPDDGVTHQVVEYIVDACPDELMYYTYEDDDTTNTETITRTLSPITLYMLGLTDGDGLIARFPTLRRTDMCAFHYSDLDDLSDYYCLKRDCPYCGGWPSDDY